MTSAISLKLCLTVALQKSLQLERPPDMAEQLILKGSLEGHSGWVTSLATSLEKYVSVWTQHRRTLR